MGGMNNMNMHMQMPMNGGYPPNNSPGGLRFNHPPPPHNNGPAFSAGGGPRMMGPPPGQGRGDNGNYWGDESMRGGPPRGGHFHRGGRGRGAEPGFRGRGRGGPRGGHNNMNGVWDLLMCCAALKSRRTLNFLSNVSELITRQDWSSFQLRWWLTSAAWRLVASGSPVFL